MTWNYRTDAIPYIADYAAAVVSPEIDGRLQARLTWHPPPLARHAAVSEIFPLPGAAPGDTALCNHPAVAGGVIISGTIESADTVRVTLVNVGQVDRVLPQGALTIDVWKTAVGPI